MSQVIDFIGVWVEIYVSYDWVLINRWLIVGILFWIVIDLYTDRFWSSYYIKFNKFYPSDNLDPIIPSYSLDYFITYLISILQ